MPQGPRYWIALGFMLTLSAALAFINFNENLRNGFRDRFIPEQREILAKALGDLTGGARSFTVLKVKNKDALSIEIFENNLLMKQTIFRARAVLPERRDAFFNYRGNAVNLLLLDVDGDGAMEIVTAGFDENLIARMHVFKFQDNQNSIESLGPDALKF